jgi:hypothetical protein
MGALMVASRAGLLLAVLLPCATSFAAEAGPAPSCANSRADLKARDIAELFLKHKGELDLKSQVGCLKLESGVELPAFLLGLPAYESPYSIRMEAPLGNGTYLLPRIDMLDAQFNTLRSFGAEHLKHRGSEMSLDIFVNSTNANERYVLIYADPQHLGEEDSKMVSQSKMVFVGTGFFIAGDDKTTTRHSASEGKLTVTLQGAQWDKAQGHH